MDKTTFMKELEQSLSVLQESEVQDILNEYEQHIDMKVKNGLSEEEAIQDFGSLAELTGEILEVYHVRSDYGNMKEDSFAEEENQSTKNWNFEKTAAKLKDAAETASSTTGSFLSRMLKITKKLLGKAGKWFTGLFPFCHDKIRRLSSGISTAWNKRKDEKLVSELKQEDGTIKTFFHRLWILIKNVFYTVKDLTFWLLRLLWNGFWIFTFVCFGCFGVLCLFCLGIVAVLMVQGYPVTGITLGCFGMSVSVFSCAGLSMTFLKKKQNFINIHENTSIENEITQEYGKDGSEYA